MNFYKFEPRQVGHRFKCSQLLKDHSTIHLHCNRLAKVFSFPYPLYHYSFVLQLHTIMRVSSCFISAVILLAGQSQSAPIFGLDGGLLSTNDQLLGGLTHTVNALPVTGELTHGLLGVSNDGSTEARSTDGLLGESKLEDVLNAPKTNSLLGGSQSGGLLNLSGYDGGSSLLKTHGLLGESSLRKRISLPLIGELGSFNGFASKAKSITSSVGSKLGGLLRRRDTRSSLPSLNSVLSKIPGVGYLPGVPNIPALSSLPGISDIPGLNLVPGLGSTTAASGLGATVTRIATTHERATMATLTDGPAQGINTAFTGFFGGLSQVPVTLDNFF